MNKELIKSNLFKRICALILAFVLTMSNFTGLMEVYAAGIATPLKITLAAAGSKEVKGSGLLGPNRRKSQKITTTIYVTVKNGDTLIEEANTVIEPTNKTKEWVVNLQNELVAGQTVYVKQKCNDDMSDEVSAEVKETLASKYKDTLKMPSGDFYLEQFSSNIISEDEKAEALQMLKDSNPSFSNEIESIEFSIKGIEENKRAYYIVKYTDNSKTEEIEASNLRIVKVTEHSRKYTLEPYNVVSTVIKGKLNGEGPFDNIKVQFSSKLSEAAKANFCKDGTCTIDKDSSNFQTIDVNPQTGEFSINVGENTLELDKVIGIVVKEKHKFATCNSSTPEIAIPKVDVKDPKKLKPEEKQAIVDAIRKANTTPGGISKLPDGTGDWAGTPAVIQVDDRGNVNIFSGNDVKGDWSNGNFVPEKNEDGSYKLNNGAKSKITFNKPEELLKNLPPDAPTIENKDGNVVVTPNIKVDTDAKKVVVEYEGADGSNKIITATKTDTGWTTDNDKAKVDENGVVSLSTKEVKSGTTVKAYVVDKGGLTPEEKAANSTKAELKVENKYKVTYDPNGGEGTMAKEEVIVGSKYRIKDNGFTAPAGKEFDHWMIGFEPKNPGDDAEVNNDIVIKAIWKYIINPTANEVETTVGHPVDYNMYKNAIKDFPSALTVEHIEVKNAPDISKVGGTQAEIEIRFSDGQFRTIPVTVNVKPDPKDATIEKLNKDIEGLNKQITDLNNTIIEKDGKITELNGKITELEEKLQECKNQCAIDKAQCEKDKKVLQEQINTLKTEKSKLEIQVKENRELIEQLRKEIAGLEKQVEDWKKIAGEKDTKIVEHENSIKELNAKLETANKANTELKENLATATEKIAGLEKEIEILKAENTELKNKIKELNTTIETKSSEIKTLNETIADLNKQITKLETEETKNKEAYEKDKANLEKQIQDAKDALTTKETELGDIKTELEQVKNDLSTEKAKTAGLEKQVNAKEEMITKLDKDIEELKAQLAKSKEGNTAVIKEKETIIKEKETTIETLKTEKAELEKQLAAEKAKNEVLEKQVTELGNKLETSDNNLKDANGKITELEKQLAAEQEKNKNLTEQLGKITTDLENKAKEVETLNGTITGLKEQLAKITAEQAKDKEACEKAKTELQEKLDKANADLTAKNEELDRIKAELEQAKKDLADEKTKNAGLTEK